MIRSRPERLLTLCCRVRDQLRRGGISRAEWQHRSRVLVRAYTSARCESVRAA